VTEIFGDLGDRPVGLAEVSVASAWPNAIDRAV
jgi:hypothetical protein